MPASSKRIEQAWKVCKDWIAEFDGSATEVYLPGVSEARLPGVLARLADETRDFRVSTVAAGDDPSSTFTRLESFPQDLERLRSGDLASLNVNYTAQVDGQPLDLHLVFHPAGKNKVDVEIVWWADQAFDEDANPRPRFDALLANFMNLQDLFQAAKLYIGPESFEKPHPGSETWIDV